MNMQINTYIHCITNAYQVKHHSIIIEARIYVKHVLCTTVLGPIGTI